MTERTIKLAEAVVLKREAQILNDIVCGCEEAIDQKKDFKAENLMDALIAEKDRQTKGTYDEEEVIIYKLERKKKRG